MKAWVTVIDQRRLTYEIHVNDPEDAYSAYLDGKIIEEDWLDDRIEDVEFEMEPPEVNWEDHEERPL